MALVRHAELTGREKVKLLTFMIATALFFGVTMLISFFLVIVVINEFKIPADIAPNVLILGLVPPSIATFLLFTKAFGRFI
jgi:uncharacterized BrkB/YihY/UPF0761 family membrane protein